MIVVDSSALVAILFAEDDAGRYVEALERAPSAAISAASILETSIVVTRRVGPAGAAELDELIARFGIEIVPFDAAQAALARDAFLRYGKGRHAAKLNFGDCMAYALAKTLDVPLLHKGADFAATDLRTV
ncbi:MAG: type II toxin-antitoxin system VapC family toxin [Tagaea sp.]